MDPILLGAIRHMERAGEILGLSAEMMDLLRAPLRVIEFRIPLRMDNGSTRIFTAFRVHHNDALGPTRDGTRIRPDLNLDEAKALAMIMSIKHAVAGVPAGGGKGGIIADPGELSDWELERLVRAYIRKLCPKGSWVDVPGADIGTNYRTQAWMLDEYEQVTGAHEPTAINDKPPLVGGSVGGEEATGRGVFYLTMEAVNDLGLSPKDCRVAVQGFGNVGSHAARLLHQTGFRVVAVGDIRGGVFSPAGIDVQALFEHCKRTGSVTGFPGTQPISNEDLIALECEILVPAAVHGVINADNAGNVKARIISEGANAPVTPEAEQILLRKAVTIIPDVLANCGGVTVCNFERFQGLTDTYWDLETVRAKLKESIVRAYREILVKSQQMSITMREAAWVTALDKICRAVHLRGWVNDVRSPSRRIAAENQ